MPLLQTQGPVSVRGYGENLKSGGPVYIEDVFSTWLYTGNDSTQTITNGIDLSTKGGMVWVKPRSGTYGTNPHRIFDTIRGGGRYIASNDTAAEVNSGTIVPSFTSSGFNLDSGTYNNSATTYASWSFEKQPKFFDIVTYTGTGANRTIAHNLGSVPGSIFVKRTDAVADWQVYHRSLANTQYMVLNSTALVATGATRWNSTTPTSTVFSLGTDTTVNASGGTYVAYIFAHDAGGFGNAGTDNVISCGSFTTTGSAISVNLGYEPQFLLCKKSSGIAGNWTLVDSMRGFQVDRSAATLHLAANLSLAESATGLFGPTSTGFTFDDGGSGETVIYIAIRRGPMKTPTVGTSVFGLNLRTGTGANVTVTGGQIADAVLIKNRFAILPSVGNLFAARLTGTGYIETSNTAAEVAADSTILQANPWDVMNGVKIGTTSLRTNNSTNTSNAGGLGNQFINYLFCRAPGFFDVVCYTGTGGARTVSHNLGVMPELIIIKNRSTAGFSSVVGANFNLSNCQEGSLNSSGGFTTYSYINQFTAQPTTTQFSLGAGSATNSNANNFISYLFATLPGISKVGSYTGTGALQTIDCGFTAGARFVLIKRTNSTGSWPVFDSARGIGDAAFDPCTLLNLNDPDIYSSDFLDQASTGFKVRAEPSGIGVSTNAVGGTYLFLAIA